MLQTLAAWVLTTAYLVHAQFPSTPEGVKVLNSKFDDGVKISYKEASILNDSEDAKH